MHHVLATGSDPSLLYTRGMVLERTDASVTIALPGHAMLLLDTVAFDVLVLCHTIPDCEIDQLCCGARAHAIKTLLLERVTGDHPTPTYVEDRFQLEDGLQMLILKVDSLLQAPKPDQPTPTSRLTPFVRCSRLEAHTPSSLQSVARSQSQAPRLSALGKLKT